MHVIICGGRAHYLTPSEYGWLDAMHRGCAFTLVYTGGASGVDSCAHQWAARCGIDTVIFPPNWQEGTAGWPRRNGRMLAALQVLSAAARAPCGVLVFPGGRGTQDMQRQAHTAGVPIYTSDKRLGVP